MIIVYISANQHITRIAPQERHTNIVSILISRSLGCARKFERTNEDIGTPRDVDQTTFENTRSDCVPVLSVQSLSTLTDFIITNCAVVPLKTRIGLRIRQTTNTSN